MTFMAYLEFIYLSILSSFGPFGSAIILTPIVISYVFVGGMIVFAIVRVVGIPYDYFVKYSKIEFFYARKEYKLYYLIRYDFLELKAGNTIDGSLTVQFKEHPLQKDEMEAEYYLNSKKLELKNGCFQLKNKTTKSMIAKWFLEKSEQEIKEIMTVAIFAVMKKKYPQLLVDEKTKEIKLSEI